MDAELLDLISRTRPVILEILEGRGYDTTGVKKMTPEELLKQAMTSPASLNLKVPAKESDTESAEEKQCHVLYWIENPTRLRIEGWVKKLWDSFENADAFNPTRDEVIVILAEPYHEVFDAQALKAWGRMKARMSFFTIKNLVVNPAKHTYVPPHRKLTEEEVKEVMAKHHIRSKMEFPRIIYHVDMQARVLGLIPGDIVEIRRPSPTAGECIVYRVCTLS